MRTFLWRLSTKLAVEDVGTGKLSLGKAPENKEQFDTISSSVTNVGPDVFREARPRALWTHVQVIVGQFSSLVYLSLTLHPSTDNVTPYSLSTRRTVMPFVLSPCLRK